MPIHRHSRRPHPLAALEVVCCSKPCHKISIIIIVSWIPGRHPALRSPSTIHISATYYNSDLIQLSRVNIHKTHFRCAPQRAIATTCTLPLSFTTHFVHSPVPHPLDLLPHGLSCTPARHLVADRELPSTAHRGCLLRPQPRLPRSRAQPQVPCPESCGAAAFSA